MKQKTIIVTLTFLAISIISISSIELNKKTVSLLKSEEFYKIYNELYTLVVNNKEKDENVYNTIIYIDDKIKNNQLLLLVDPENENKDILSNAFFIFSIKNENPVLPYIVVNRNFIDTFNKQKSIIFSILIHEIRHAYDYFTSNANFIASKNNSLESYLYQMDALFLEALFIEKFLEPNGYNLTKFEKLLLDSHKKDNLSLYSLIFECTNRDLVYYIYKLNSQSYKDDIDTITKIGKDISESFKNLKSQDPEKNNDFEWNKYYFIITLNSFIKYTPQICFNIISSKTEYKINNFNLKDYSNELYELLNDISKLIAPYSKFIEDFRSKFFMLVKSDKIFDENISYEFLIFRGKITYLHILPSDIVITTKKITSGGLLGTTELLPDIMSKAHNINIKKSIELYNKKQYREATEILENAIKKEPDNPFILNYIAKAYFWFDREKSFLYYKKLIEILDKQTIEVNKLDLEIKNLFSENKKDDNENIKKDIIEIAIEVEKISQNVKIDLWFTEAYWKLGCLYLDIGEYLKAAYEITRALLAMPDEPTLKEQAYSYLCEAYCFLNKKELAKYCAEQVYKINPFNSYVTNYLKMLETANEGGKK